MWFGSGSFQEPFPRINNILEDKDKVIDWEVEPMSEFLNIILFQQALVSNEEDLWEWTLEGSRSISSKSAYRWLHEHCPSLDVRGDVENVIFKQFWKKKEHRQKC